MAEQRQSRGDVMGRRGTDVTQGKAVSSLYRTAFVQKQLQQKGPRHNREGDAWREYGNKTAHLPDANPWHIDT